MERVDVMVVGAGIIGASIGFQLARRGVDVVVVDKAGGPAEGSTGASAAFIRCRYSRPEMIQLARDSQRAFVDWSVFIGLDTPRARYHETGVLWMLGKGKAEIQAEADRLAVQGVAAAVIGPDELRLRYPAISPCDVHLDLTGEIDHVCSPGEAFLFEEEGGFIDPVGATQDLLDGVRAHGSEVWFRKPVAAIDRSGGRVTGVSFGDGTSIETPTVINAAGPWCNQLNRMAGIELTWTLTPTRVQMLHRPWPREAGEIPITLDTSTLNGYRLEASGEQILTVSGRPEDEGELVDDPDDFKISGDVAHREINLAALHHRFPTLEPRGTPGGLAGLYTINREDHHPVVGPTELDGFWIANGFSGHGLKLAPGIGSMIAQAVTGASLPYDTEVAMATLSHDREPFSLGVKNVYA